MMPRYHRILHRSIDRGITDFTIFPLKNRPVGFSSGTRLYATKNLSLRETIDHIKETILLSEIVGEYVDIHEEGNRGRGHQCLCPFHDDRNPSMHINDDKGSMTDQPYLLYYINHHSSPYTPSIPSLTYITPTLTLPPPPCISMITKVL